MAKDGLLSTMLCIFSAAECRPERCRHLFLAHQEAGISRPQPAINLMTQCLLRFNMLLRSAVLAALCSADVGSAVAAENATEYTSIAVKACRKQAPSAASRYDYRGECPAPKGWRVFVGEGGDRSWLEVGRGKTVWSTEDVVLNDGRLGNFPNVGEGLVEWRRAASSPEKGALIFRVSGQNPDDPGKKLSHLLVIGLTESAPRFCGLAKTNEQARELADSLSACTVALQKLP
jgi:hypothetical protein